MGRSYEERIAGYDAQIARMRARRQAAVARHGKEERRARTHALCVIGGMVESCFEGGWKAVDWQALANLVESNRSVFAERAAEPLPLEQASRRLREWEAASRGGARCRRRRQPAEAQERGVVRRALRRVAGRSVERQDEKASPQKGR